MGYAWRIGLAIFSALALLVSGIAIDMAITGKQIWSPNGGDYLFGQEINLPG